MSEWKNILKYGVLIVLFSAASASLFAGGKKEEPGVKPEAAPVVQNQQQEKQRVPLAVNAGAVATVNGESITEEAFNAQIENLKKSYLMQRGTALPPDQEEILKKQVLQAMISKYVLLQKYREMGLSVDPDRVEQEFQKVKDQYPSEADFNNALTEQGYDTARLRKEITQSLQVYKIQQEVVADVAVTDDEMKRGYNANLDKFTQPESVRARHILVQVEANASEEQKAEAMKKIEAIQAELSGGADFAEVAKAKSEGPSGPNGGDLGYFTADKMVPPFSTAAFALKPGETSGIVETQFGYHIIKVEERKDPWLPSFDQVKDSLEPQLLQQKQQMVFEEYLINAQSAAEINIIRPDLQPEENVQSAE